MIVKAISGIEYPESVPITACNSNYDIHFYHQSKVYRIIDTARQRNIRRISSNKRIRSSAVSMTAPSSPPSSSSAPPHSSSSSSPTLDRQIDYRPNTSTAHRLLNTTRNGNPQSVSFDEEFLQCNADAIDLNQSKDGLAAAIKVIDGDYNIIICAPIMLSHFRLPLLVTLIAAFTRQVYFVSIVNAGN